ncbi:MAG: DUF4824 family protein [Nitrospiraceae bacterium]
MKRVGLWTAMALVLGTNALVLTVVASNRFGEGEALLHMTERELPLSSASDENTGITLRLRWQQQPELDRGPGPGWFDQAKLEALGYDCSVPLTDLSAKLHYSKATPRRAFVVLEYEGDAWRQWLADAEREVQGTAEGVQRRESSRRDLQSANDRLDRLRKLGSRLIAVDVGADPDQLRQAYPDRTRFIVAPAEVNLIFLREWTGKDGIYHPPYLGGRMSQLLVQYIHAPTEKRGVLAHYARERMYLGPRYSVTIHYGHRYEPWIVGVEPLSQPPS